MSIRLRELIRAVRACKTAAEEREVVAKESAALREAFKDQDPRYRHRNVAKLMYIHMLGYPTHFGQMECLKLIAANGFPEKRIGYLGLMILLDERQEVLMLVTNSLKIDLNHKNQYIAGLALAALGNICSTEMARDLAPDVEKLLESPNPYVRKKAALCALRIVKKVPDLIESFLERAAETLGDKHHAVMLTGVALMLQICELDPEAIEAYRKHVPLMCKILKSLLQSGFSPEHDVGGITDPFLQVKVLRLLRLLGKNNSDASDKMSDILAQVAANIEGNRNAGNAILYECVQTIMGVESIGGLRVLAVNILGKFLANKDNNIRYVALNTLARIVTVDTQAVQRHRNTIVDCVKDADVSIRKRALELVYSLVNEGNIKNLTKELLEYLVICDAEFKPDLTAKICMLIQRFSPDKRWHIDSLLEVMSQAAVYVKEEVCRAFIVLITNATELQGYAVRSLYRALSADTDYADASLVITSVWAVGEFGDLLLPSAGGALLDGEAPLTVSDAEIVGTLEAIIKRTNLEPVCKQYALTALMKLTARLPAQVQRLRAVIDRYRNSLHLEVQARSCEFHHLFKYDNIRPQILERMPAVDESEYAQNLAGEVKPAAPTAPSSSLQVASAPKAAADLLGGLDLLGLSDVPAAAQAAVDPLAALLAPTSTSAPAGGAADLLDLLGGGLSAAPAAAINPVAAYGAPPSSVHMDPLASFMDAPAVPAPAPSSAFAPIVAWQKNGITVNFAFTKNPANPALTEITATYTNSTAAPINDFVFQAAVPKFMQLKLEPATGTALMPYGGAPVVQKLLINNTMHGQKNLAMRLRIAYSMSGQPVLEQAEVSNFPSGL